MAEYQTSQVHVQRFILKKSIATIILLETLEEDGKIEIIRGKTRGWIRRREEKGYFNNIVQKLIIVKRMRFSIVIMIHSVLVPKQCGFQNQGIPHFHFGSAIIFLATSRFPFCAKNAAVTAYLLELWNYP